MTSYSHTSLNKDWFILQDVHDVGEQLGLPVASISNVDPGSQLSEWEPLPRLEHLQVVLADNPYWGRELRYFNQAPWWYKRSFEADPRSNETAVLRFTHVDYACRVWLNGTLLGEHEGYSNPFEFDVSELLVPGTNVLLVKVWSDWDKDIRDDNVQRRTFMVERRMVKGTYEHDDTLIARDVNPIGIYGDVELITAPAVIDVDGLRVDYTLDADDVDVCVSARFMGIPAETTFPLRIREVGSGRVVASSTAVVDADGHMTGGARVQNVRRWSTWDHGSPWLYAIEVDLPWGCRETTTVGFRELEIEREQDRTIVKINKQRVYVRGTSYFPDTYISRMYRERYLRDLQAIRDAGFNVVRVHVHVEKQEFYDLCDELGLAVMQDSEYNWTHPETEEFADRITNIYLETMRQLHNHPSLVTWICLNEPGAQDPAGGSMTGGSAMTVAPGPAMLAAVSAADPSRPLILGSYCEADPHSGDSHNYRGSLYGENEDYVAIDGSVEKLNTEFGIDAPGVLQNLLQYPQITGRFETSSDLLQRAQDYQYRLVKYYTEHYRRQRFSPCAGYIQFMFIDLSPQSWYGVLDYWGIPKPVWSALLESNQPVAVLLDQDAKEAQDIILVNDTPRSLGEVSVEWAAYSPAGNIWSGTAQVVVPADSTVRVTTERLTQAEHGSGVAVRIVAFDSDGCQVAKNCYNDLFDHPAHIAGHPHRMSHEMGMRLFDMP